MPKQIVARWQDWSGSGIEHAVIRETGSSILVESVVLSANEGVPFAVQYRLRCDASWAMRDAQIAIVGSDRRIELAADGLGHWTDGSGARLAHLDGAIDIDLSASPFTNTLPIRRLHMQQGQACEILAAYVAFPGLTVIADPQRYTCLEPMKRYRYESLDSDFVREIEVDADGLVVTYPGLFRRLL